MKVTLQPISTRPKHIDGTLMTRVLAGATIKFWMFDGLDYWAAAFMPKGKRTSRFPEMWSIHKTTNDLDILLSGDWSKRGQRAPWGTEFTIDDAGVSYVRKTMETSVMECRVSYQQICDRIEHGHECAKIINTALDRGERVTFSGCPVIWKNVSCMTGGINKGAVLLEFRDADGDRQMATAWPHQIEINGTAYAHPSPSKSTI